MGVISGMMESSNESLALALVNTIWVGLFGEFDSWDSLVAGVSGRMAADPLGYVSSFLMVEAISSGMELEESKAGWIEELSVLIFPARWLALSAEAASMAFFRASSSMSGEKRLFCLGEEELFVEALSAPLGVLERSFSLDWEEDFPSVVFVLPVSGRLELPRSALDFPCSFPTSAWSSAWKSRMA